MYIGADAHTMALISTCAPLSCSRLGCLWRRHTYPTRRSAERLFGKMGFVASCRPCVRGVFEHAYVQLHEALARQRPRLLWSAALSEEAFVGALLMPLACVHLGHPFSSRAFCSDASPGGHGFCDDSAPVDDVPGWCRMAEFRGDHSQLCEEEALHAPAPGAPPPARVSLQLAAMWWRRIGRPGRPMRRHHIAAH